MIIWLILLWHYQYYRLESGQGGTGFIATCTVGFLRFYNTQKGLRLLHIITLWAALVTTMTYCWEGVLTLFIRLYNVLRIIWFRCNPGKIVHWLLLVLYPIVGLRAIDCCLDYCSLWTSQCGCRRRRSCLSFRPSSWLHSSTTLSSERPRWTSLTGFQDD